MRITYIITDISDNTNTWILLKFLQSSYVTMLLFSFIFTFKEVNNRLNSLHNLRTILRIPASVQGLSKRTPTLRIDKIASTNKGRNVRKPHKRLKPLHSPQPKRFNYAPTPYFRTAHSTCLQKPVNISLDFMPNA